MGPEEPTEGAGAVREVGARRLSTAPEGEGPVEERVGVALEAAVSVDVEGVETYTLLCTPEDTVALAAGFLLTEGVIDGLEEVTHLQPCEEEPSVVRVRVKQRVPRLHDEGRNLLIVSSCGLCGAASLEEKLRGMPRVEDSLRLEAAVLPLVSEELRRRQTLFRSCGGTHAAGIFDRAGNLVATAEDVGRHNALDKAIGRCLIEGRSPAGYGAVLSGRVSLEMVGKCARAGIELISAISAPTSLAIEVAERCGITLCAFVRETRATVFSHPARIVSGS
jgi:FdhD protein